MPASLTVSISLFLLFESGGERGKEKWRDFAEYQAETEGEMDPHIVLKTVKVQVSMVYQDYGSFTFVGCFILERKHMHINYVERTFKNKEMVALLMDFKCFTVYPGFKVHVFLEQN